MHSCIFGHRYDWFFFLKCSVVCVCVFMHTCLCMIAFFSVDLIKRLSANAL